MALKYGVAVGVAAAVAAGVGSKHACARDRWTVNDSEFLSVSFKTLSAARREGGESDHRGSDGVDGFGIR